MNSWAKIYSKQLTTCLSFPVEGKKWGKRESKKQNNNNTHTRTTRKKNKGKLALWQPKELLGSRDL